MKFELSEDHFLFMLFLKEKPRSMGELLEYSPPNKVWNQDMQLDVVNQLDGSKLMDRKFFDDKQNPDGSGPLHEPIFRLNKKGETLLENYIKQQKEIEDRKDLELRQMQSVVDTNNSVIATNTAMRDNIPVQNRQAKFSIWVGIFSGLFILVSIAQGYFDTTSKELKGVKEELQELRKAQQSLISNPEQKHDSSQIDKGTTHPNK